MAILRLAVAGGESIVGRGRALSRDGEPQCWICGVSSGRKGAVRASAKRIKLVTPTTPGTLLASDSAQVL